MTRTTRRTHTRRLIAGVFTLASAAFAAAGQDYIPEPETGPKIVNMTKVGSKWEMRDAESGKLIMQERNCVPQTQGFAPEVQRDIEIRVQPSGYDMIVTFTNPTGVPKPAGSLYSGMFTLGPAITFFDFRYGSQPMPANFATFVGQHYNYPDSQYAPVWVITNGEYAVGVSLIYPMLEFQHDARMGLMNPTGSNSGEGGPGWGIAARISNRGTEPPEQRLPFESMIPPGQQRTYVLSVRVTNNPSEWTRTLLPYRKYFRKTFGGVTYRRDGRLLQPVVVAETSYLEPSNPMGFTWIASRRPDIFGWKPWAEALKQTPRDQIQMLWAPSGLYYERADENFPFQMTTHWQSSAKLATALDPTNGLKSAADAGVPLGLWWGRSIEVPDKWEPTSIVDFDPDNPDHRAAAFAEMDLAVQAGVTFVGLDTFNPGRTQVAKLYSWLHEMRVRYPKVKFIVEPNACDMLHTLAGSFISGWKDQTPPETPEGLYRVTAPHALADFLLPGHETFLGFRYNGYRQYFNIQPTPDLIEEDIRKFAAMGYTPVLFEDMSTAPPVPITRTWESTVPHDLRLSPAIYPLRGSPALAIGQSYRPAEPETAAKGSKGGGEGAGNDGGSGVSTIARVYGTKPTRQTEQQQQQGTAGSSVNTIVNSKSTSAPGSPVDALSSTTNGAGTAAQALERAGFFTALPSTAKSKAKVSSKPIKVVTSKSSEPTKTAGADGDQ
ncbi:MAG: hypothetical protein GIKADHBN_02152 [Phycisphaerales bacterium]|nr:hypothetical protein [Phycisphaerales bacterium]